MSPYQSYSLLRGSFRSVFPCLYSCFSSYSSGYFPGHDFRILHLVLLHSPGVCPGPCLSPCPLEPVTCLCLYPCPMSLSNTVRDITRNVAWKTRHYTRNISCKISFSSTFPVISRKFGLRFGQCSFSS